MTTPTAVQPALFGAAAIDEFKADLHPRGFHGRFTKSFSRAMTPGEKRKAERVAAGFKAAPLDVKAFAAPLGGRSTDETAAIARFNGGDWKAVNTALRAGKDHPDVAHLDSATQPLPHDTLLHRQVPLSSLGKSAADPEALVGRKVKDAAYAPTSVAAPTGAGPVVRMQISAPAGTKALALDSDGNVLLARDSEMAIESVTPDGHGGFDMNLVVLPKGRLPAAKKTEPAAPDEPTAPTHESIVAHASTMSDKELAKLHDAIGTVRKQRQTGEVPAAKAGDRVAERQAQAAAFDARAEKAWRGEDALYAAPVSFQENKALKPPPGVKWSRPERTSYYQAIDDYQADGYKAINKALRQGQGDPSGADKKIAEQIADLDQVLADSPLDGDVVVYRGIQGPERIFPGVDTTGDLTGLEWKEHGYGSTTADLQVAREFSYQGGGAAGGDSVVMRIIAPGGTPALQLSQYVGRKPDAGDHMDRAEEAEMLLGRGLHYRVIADRGVSDDDGLRHLDVEVVGGHENQPGTGLGSDGATAGRGDVTGDGVAAPKPAKPPTPAVDHHVEHLKQIQGKLTPSNLNDPVEEAQKYLAGVKGAQLDALTKAIGTHGRTAADKRKNILQVTVGREADSLAIRFGGQGKEPGPAPALQQSIASGVAETKRLGGGVAADTSLVTFKDSGQAVQKVAKNSAERPPREATDAEYLAAAFGRAAGVQVPEVHRSAPNTVYMGYVADAETGMEKFPTPWGSPEVRPEVTEIAATPAGRRLGLFDLVVGNTDRNDGNWLVDDAGTLHGIDHGMSFQESESIDQHAYLVTGQNPFAGGLLEISPHGNAVIGGSRAYSAADIEHLGTALASVADEFDGLGRTSWYLATKQRLTWLAQFAGGDGSLFG